MVTENWKERESGAQGSLDDFKVTAPQTSFCQWGSVGDLREEPPCQSRCWLWGFCFYVAHPVSNAVFSDYQGALASLFQIFSYLH